MIARKDPWFLNPLHINILHWFCSAKADIKRETDLFKLLCA